MRLFSTAIALLLGTVLMAGAPSKWTFGPTGSVNWATSPALKEVTNEKVGLGGGLHATYQFAAKQAIRVRTDYVGFPTTVRKFSNVYTLDTKANLWSGEVDYLYFVTKKVYVQGGFGVAQWQNQYYGKYPAYFGRKNFLEDAAVKQPIVTAGVGYQIPVGKLFVKSVALEARFVSTQLAGSANANTVQAGLVVSF